MHPVWEEKDCLNTACIQIWFILCERLQRGTISALSVAGFLSVMTDSEGLFIFTRQRHNLCQINRLTE